jgi:hypothetical protein
MRGSARFLTLVALLLALAIGATARAAPASHGIEYRGGRWFDGTRFVPRTMYVVDGVFRNRAPASVDSVVDLAGGHVVPPFADAHQHLYAPIEPTIRAYLRAGIFYVRDQANAPIGRRALQGLNRPASFDYVSANQGWTSPGGHPVEVILRGAPAGTPLGDMIRARMDPDFAMLVDTPADVERHWPLFMAGDPRPDFVKIFLLYSEDHARRRADRRFEGNRGLDPALVPVIVRLAHRAGLRVSAHVYTAADFRAAVAGGVDQIAHLPGGHLSADATFLITEADARLARRRGVTVITTISQHGDAALTDRLVRTQYAHNIRLLRRHGVPLLLGSDRFGDTAVTEAAALARSGLFTNLELLRMWSVTTPRAIFPTRRIGALRDGYEASFLVLEGDPLADFANTSRIVRRVKQGVPI